MLLASVKYRVFPSSKSRCGLLRPVTTSVSCAFAIANELIAIISEKIIFFIDENLEVISFHRRKSKKSSKKNDVG